MRVVIDTNLLLSGFLWQGLPHVLLGAVRQGRLRLVMSAQLLAEFTGVLGRSKFDSALVRTDTSRERLLQELQRLVEMVEPEPLAQPVCRDPDDDAVLALAVSARVDWVVSGDDDLLVLHSYASIPILSANQALRQLGLLA